MKNVREENTVGRCLSFRNPQSIKIIRKEEGGYSNGWKRKKIISGSNNYNETSR